MEKTLTGAVFGESETVTITYSSASKNEITERKISNISASYKNGKFTMIAFCHLREAVKCFSLQNILELKINDMPVDKYQFFSRFVKNKNAIIKERDVTINNLKKMIADITKCYDEIIASME
jgi:predicted DNA-binding transcriptional regulator YafY